MRTPQCRVNIYDPQRGRDLRDGRRLQRGDDGGGDHGVVEWRAHGGAGPVAAGGAGEPSGTGEHGAEAPELRGAAWAIIQSPSRLSVLSSRANALGSLGSVWRTEKSIGGPQRKSIGYSTTLNDLSGLPRARRGDPC